MAGFEFPVGPFLKEPLLTRGVEIAAANLAANTLCDSLKDARGGHGDIE